MTRRVQIIIYALTALLLAMVGSGFGILLTPAFSLYTALFVAGGALIALALAWAARRLNPWLSVAAALAALAALAVPGLRPHMYGGPAADGSGMLQLWWLPGVTLVLAAVVFGSGLSAARSRRQRGVCLALAGLLLAASLHALYWQLMWDSAVLGRDRNWMVLPGLAALTTLAVLLGPFLSRVAQRPLMIGLALLVPLLGCGMPAALYSFIILTWSSMEETPRVNDVVLADLDSDGHLDAFLAVGNGSMPFPAYALYNDGTGHFDQGAQPIGKWPGFSAALGDVNGDGLPDALLDITAGGIIIYYNDGGALSRYAGLAEPGPIGVMRFVPALGDLDADGRLDVFAAGCCGRPPGESPNTVNNPFLPPYSQTWLQTANGQLRAGQQVGDAASHAAALADLNGDGHLDVFLANGRAFVNFSASNAFETPQPNTVWLNDGHGNFTDSGQRLGQAESRAVALGDVNGDGFPDAIVGNNGENDLWLNDGRGSFTISGQRLGSNATQDVFLVDLDGDGDLDAFLAGGITGRAWLNDGRGGLTASAQVLRYATDNAVAVGDLTGDGLPDVLVAGPSAYRVWANDGTGRFADGPRGNYR